MKTIITLILLFFILSTSNSIAQPKVEKLSNKTSLKGRWQLRKENKIHNATDNLADNNERKSRRKNHLGTLSNYKANRKEITKERKRSKKKEGKTKDAIAKTKIKNKEDKPSE